MEHYLLVLCCHCIPVTLEDYYSSDGFLTFAKTWLDEKITLATLLGVDPVPDLYCEVWQYVTHDEMKKIITIF